MLARHVGVGRWCGGEAATSGVARMVVVVRLVVVVAREAASVVKVAAARRRWRWMGRGGGGGEWRREVVRPYPLRPKHPLWCSGGV